MKEIEVSGKQYRLGKLPLVQQFHISRILMPVIYAGVPVLTVERFSQLGERDSAFVIDSCLAVVERKQETGWAKIGDLKMPMFSVDMKLLDYYEIAAAVIEDSLGNFFSEMLSRLAEAMGLKASD